MIKKSKYLYLLFRNCWYIMLKKERIIVMKKNIVILFLLFLIMGTVFCYMYVRNEDPVYVYDYC